MEKRREKGGGRRREGKGERETGSTERVCVRARAREGEGIEERRDPPRETLGRGKRRTGRERERRRGTGRYAARNILEYLRNLVAGH